MAYNNLGSVMSGLGFGDQQMPMLPIPQQAGGLGQLAPQPTESPADVLSKEKARLTGGLSDDVLMEILRKEASGDGLSALETAKNTQTKALTDMLMKQSEYSGLDKVMAGLANINLAPVPKGYSSIAYGLQGTANAADKFASLKDKYKQTALELQAKEAQKAYDSQWAEAKQARQLLMTDAMADKRNESAERRAAINNEAKEKIAKAKALVTAGKIPPNTMAKLIADAETAVQNDFANGRITNDATERQMLKDKYVAEGVQKILGDEWTTSIPSVIPQSQVPAAQGFQGDPNAIMGELARIPNEADKIAAGAQYEQQLTQTEVPSATPTSQAPSAKPAALTKSQLDTQAAADKKAAEYAAEASAPAGSTPGLARTKVEAEALDAVQSAETVADNAMSKVLEILKPENKDGFESSFGGYNAYATSLKSGNTAKVQSNISELKDAMKNAGLQLMRAGGSIGAMTVQEWPIVEGMIASLSPKLSEDDAREKLLVIQNFFTRVKENARNVYKERAPSAEKPNIADTTAVPTKKPTAPVSAASRLKAFPKDKP